MGLLQPLTVRRGEHGWELVAGERRLRAAKLAGLRQVPCLVRSGPTGQTSSLFALVENLQRRDLDFWEEALALRPAAGGLCPVPGGAGPAAGQEPVGHRQQAAAP